MMRRRASIAVVGATSLVLLLALGLRGWTGTFASGGASITLSPTSGPAGSAVSVSGSGFKGRETVALYFDTSQVGSAQASAGGAFTAQITVPGAATPGSHTVKATGQKTGKTAQAPFTVTQVAASADWPMYGFDATHAGANPNEHTLSTATVPNLSVAWNASVYSSTSWSSVAVAGGMVYAQTSQLYAYNASTGALVWTANVPGNGGPASSPAVANGVVYAASYTGSLYALNATTGATIWSDTVAANLPSQSAPAVANGTVYEGWDDGYLHAFNAQTGAQEWSFNVGTDIYSSPSVANGIVYLTAGSSLYALDANTGVHLWTYSVGSNPSTPAVVNGTVYVVASNLYALNATTGALQWSASTGLFIPTYCSLAVSNGLIYLYSGDVHAFSAATGAPVWHSTTGNTPATPASSPVVANGVVYTGSGASAFYAYDAQTGAQLWTYSTPGASADVTPVVANGMLYMVAGANPPQLYAFH
jgi:eukaryotic-like serine/threonine-protein kinase